MNKSTMWYIIVCVAGSLMFGVHMATYVFGGVVTLLGFYALIEFIPLLKWMIYHWGRLIDVCFYAFTIYATMNYGVTIAMSLTIASLGYTMVLVPYIRDTYNLK